MSYNILRVTAVREDTFSGPLLGLNFARYRVLGHSCVSVLGNSLDDTLWHNTVLYLLEGQEDERAQAVLGGPCK